MANLSNPVIEINDEIIKIKPNSCSYNVGTGERTVRTQSAGGRSIDTVYTVNAETMISMLKFTLATTQEHVEKYTEWLDNEDRNLARLSERGSSFNIVFRKMAVISNNEITLGSEGEVEIEFQGPPVI